jgi:serine/threonine-protein kinase RsbW
MSSRNIELKIESDPANLAAVRKAVESFAQNMGEFGEPCCGNIGLCVNEILANVIRHAYGNRTDRPIHVRAAVDEERLVIEIRDWGNGIDPSRVKQAPYDPLKPGGVGLICIRELMDDITYHPQPDGMLTRMTMRRRVTQ